MLAWIGAGIAAVGSLVSGAVSAISSAIATIGPTVCNFAKGVIEVFSKMPGGLNTILNVKASKLTTASNFCRLVR